MLSSILACFRCPFVLKFPTCATVDLFAASQFLRMYVRPLGYPTARLLSMRFVRPGPGVWFVTGESGGNFLRFLLLRPLLRSADRRPAARRRLAGQRSAAQTPVEARGAEGSGEGA